MIEVADEYVKLGNTIIPHNEYVWRSCTNRHTTTSGNSWGWIENSPGNVCWSNDYGSELSSKDAQALVNAHNKWLEDIQPFQIKMMKARKAVKDLTATFKTKEQEYLQAKEKLEKAEDTLKTLLEVVDE